MSYGYQLTREEEACERLLEEIREELSEAARTVIAEAATEAYKFNLVSNYAYSIEEYDEAKAVMRLAAANLTDRDCELLRAYVRTTIAAFASIDRYDVDTLVGHKVDRADLHHYYEMKWRMIDDILTFREGQVRPQEAAKQDPTDPSDLPF